MFKAYANRPNPYFLDVGLLNRFPETLEPMRDKLGPVMFQFEYLNKKNMPSKKAFLERLDAFFEQAPEGFDYAVETRNPNYLSEDFFDFLRDRTCDFVMLEGCYIPPSSTLRRNKSPQRHSPLAEWFDARKYWDAMSVE